MSDIEVRLPNGSCGDALVLARLPLLGRCIVFDAGDTTRLPPRDTLRVSHLLASHCHVDHFVGFDALVRPRVCRTESMGAAGPEGFLGRVQSRLEGYDWNLVEGNHFVLTVREMGSERTRVARFDSGLAFAREDLPEEPPGRVVLDDVGLVAESEALDHHLVSQGWAIQAPPRIHVRTDELAPRGLAPGPWLAELKDRVRTGRLSEDLDLPNGRAARGADLARDLLSITTGPRVAFVTDTICDAATRPRIVRLAAAADVFACGAPFLEAGQAERARRTRHLTAAQAGALAAEAGARQLLLFHVSERYGGDLQGHVEEALTASRGAVEVITEPPWPLQET